jgi:MFS family permease
MFLLQVFVLLLSFLVTLQQALSSGYINSVITTIEKRFEIPSSLSGLIASSYEIGNVITVIFVSYLGSRRHIPVWIAVGKFWSILYRNFLLTAEVTFLKNTAIGKTAVDLMENWWLGELQPLLTLITVLR